MLHVSNEFGYPILASICMGFHCLLVSFGVGPARYGSMNEQYIQANFAAENELHMKEFGVPIAKGGHPDNGLGRLSDKLDFVSWVKLQNAQRAHGNYLETLTFSMAATLLGGVFYPRITAISGVIHIIGRQMYASGFKKGGAAGRGKGFAIVMITLLINFVCTLVGAITLLTFKD